MIIFVSKNYYTNIYELSASGEQRDNNNEKKMNDNKISKITSQ